MSEILKKTESRGYWTVTIRPSDYSATRVRLSELEEIVRRCRVYRRGWAFPHLNGYQPVPRTAEGIGLETEFEHILEIWRLARSGQFVHVSSLWDDWRDQSVWKPSPKWEPLTQLGIMLVLARFQEIFQFAAALAASPAGGAEMVIE